jgi:hypothetical protein
VRAKSAEKGGEAWIGIWHDGRSKG